MAEIHAADLEGERIRYNDDTWEFTGTLDVKRNGELIHAEAKKPDRVRKNRGTLSFTLQNPPASINPGNLGSVGISLEERDDGQYLVAARPNATNTYKLDSLSYS
ncbi:hypothetical protein [Natrononativus amylolyticus]|uniref:hypothetical protein n=1 Tax=Natrononativus amylolyticus TaxID=2963434 RepID=UPI0020CB6C4E|nr:hypothetical protein [Natrononativus amylolyticus]